MAEPRLDGLSACREGLRLRARQPRRSGRRRMAEDFRPAGPADGMSDERTQNLIVECRRQEESCLYMSTTLYEWLKSLRWWRIVFVIVPIILGALATWPLLAKLPELQWVTGACALLAGVMPAIYKAL